MGGAKEDIDPPVRANSRLQLLLRLIGFGFVAVVAVYIGFLACSVNEARLLVQRFGYFTIAGTFVWSVVAVVRIGPGWLRSWSGMTRQEVWAAGGVALLLTLVAVVTVPYTYKVLYDEFVLQATAWSLHEARIVGAVVRAYDIGGVFTTLQTYLDKRPFFFAFLISLLHDLTGPRTANAFIFNTVLMPVSIGLVYLLARRLVSHWPAMAALCAFGAFSLLAQNATGSGMELLNLVMLLIVMHLGIWYLEAPDETRLTALVLTTILLAQSRYESSLYVAPAALVVLEGWRRRDRLILPMAAILAPAMLIPYALHNTYVSGMPFLWELREGEATRFGGVYFMGNLSHALKFFFDFSGQIPNSTWLAVAGLPAMIWTVWVVGHRVAGWRQASPVVVLHIIFGVGITANLGLLMFYYWGQLDDPIVSRLSLPFSMLLALCIAWTITQFPRSRQKGVAQLAITGAILSYLSTGLVANGVNWALNLQAREIAWELNAVQNMSPEPRLILTNKSSLIWLTNEISSIQIIGARHRVEAIRYHLAQHTFAEILVTQNYRPVNRDGGFQLDPIDRLPSEYVLEPVLERRFGTHIARISRVKELLPVKAASTENPEEVLPPS
ncbi:MAG: glycosyltransferase family 39 protein [Cephaloticoccus sp.]|nr:glycosyltransferase family 39 protein [Cephaloticoccus sp.]MCF7759723.1 glycosyltransferase family 39 protein [Cephaloticoccus sp.]